MSEYFKLPDFNPDLLHIAMVKSYVSSMKQEYISYWQNTVQHSQKLEFHRSFLKPIIPPLVTNRLNKRNSWEKGFSKTTNKQSQTNDRNRQMQSNYEG